MGSKCDCGAVAVNSDKHSTWCSVEQDRDVIDEVCNFVRQAKKNVLYISEDNERQDYVFQELQTELMKDLDFAALGSIKLSNGSWVAVISEDVLDLYVTSKDIDLIVVENEEIINHASHLLTMTGIVYVTNREFDLLSIA